MKVSCIPNPELGRFLERDPRPDGESADVDLRGVFCDILRRANDLLPSAAGSIFLDDPLVEPDDLETPATAGGLVLIACFGELAEHLVGTRLATSHGIVGHVYRVGQAYISNSPIEDPHFSDGFLGNTGFTAKSVICAPLEVEHHVIGVLELLNHVGESGYQPRDLNLLQIFAQTISASIVSSIDAQRSREMTRRDDLTGLFNDRYLHDMLTRVVSEATGKGEDCGLIFLDLDHFKDVNDAYGHLVGSRVLAEVGATIRQVIPGGAVAARYGGDEFVIVVPGAGPQEAWWAAETVRRNVESAVFLEAADPVDPVNYPALSIRDVVTCSLGIATLKRDFGGECQSNGGDQVALKNRLMRRADSRMYLAKERGRNRTVADGE